MSNIKSISHVVESILEDSYENRKLKPKGPSQCALQYNDAAIVALSGSPERISICLTLVDDWKIYSRVNCHHPAKKFLLF